jgi:integrase
MKHVYLVKGYHNQYYVRFKRPSGKWTMLSTKETDEELAKKKLEIFLKNNVLKLPVEEEDDKFDDKDYNLLNLKDKYIEIFNVKKRKGLDSLFKELIELLGNKKISELTVIDAEKYKKYKSENIYRGKKTVYACNLNIRILKALFNKCIRAEFINKNVWKSVRQIKIPEKRKLSFESYEIEILLKAIKNENIKNIFLFGLYTGCRLNEIINLKWENVNFKDNLIEIINDDDFTTKSKRNRYIPISEKLKEILIQKRLTKYVFAKESGHKYTGGYVSKKFKHYIRKAKLPEKYHFHCTRHSFCTTILKNNTPLVVAQKLMGHANIQTTMNYTHVGTEEMRKAVNLI